MPPAGQVDVALVRTGTREAAARTTPDEHGVFTLQADPGSYDVLIRGGAGVLALPALELR